MFAFLLLVCLLVFSLTVSCSLKTGWSRASEEKIRLPSRAPELYEEGGAFSGSGWDGGLEEVKRSLGVIAKEESLRDCHGE